MANRARKFYSPAEKSAFVAEVERLYRAGGRSYASIARELGINDSSYHAWTRRGIKSASMPAPPVAHRVFEPAERERLVGEVDGLRCRGYSLKSACQGVGISDKSYRKWKDAPAAPLPMRVVEVTALVPVATALAIVPPTGPALAGREPGGAPAALDSALTLVAPGGYRIEGLGIESAAQLLRALAC
jgi:transposase-like protein